MRLTVMDISRKCKSLMVALSAPFLIAPLQGQEPPPKDVNVVVLGNRVNVRARPNPSVEVVFQADYGDVLKGGAREGEWVMVRPPADTPLYVASEFVQDGVVTATELNVRCGPSENFSIVARLPRGEKPVARETRPGWLVIDPPADATLWIHESLVRVETPAPPVKPAPVVAAPAPAPEPKPSPAPVQTTPKPPPPVRSPVVSIPPPVTPPPVVRPVAPPPPPPPSDLDLIPFDGQGQEVIRSGMVYAYILRAGSPSRFHLNIEVNGEVQSACYVKGDEDMLSPWIGKPVRVWGRDYWVRGQKKPVMVPERIEGLSALP